MKITSSTIWAVVRLLFWVAFAMYILFFTELDWWVRGAVVIANVVLAALNLFDAIKPMNNL